MPLHTSVCFSANLDACLTFISLCAKEWVQLVLESGFVHVNMGHCSGIVEGPLSFLKIQLDSDLLWSLLQRNGHTSHSVSTQSSRVSKIQTLFPWTSHLSSQRSPWRHPSSTCFGSPLPPPSSACLRCSPPSPAHRHIMWSAPGCSALPVWFLSLSHWSCLQKDRASHPLCWGQGSQGYEKNRHM